MCLLVVEEYVAGARNVHEADAQEVAALHAVAGQVICCKPPLPIALHYLDHRHLCSVKVPHDGNKASFVLGLLSPGAVIVDNIGISSLG